MNIIPCPPDTIERKLEPVTSHDFPSSLIVLGYDEIDTFKFNDLTNSPYYKMGLLFNSEELVILTDKLGKAVDIESLQIYEICKIFSIDRINFGDKYLVPWLEKYGKLTIDKKGIKFNIWGRTTLDENTVLHKCLAAIQENDDSLVLQFYQIFTQATVDFITFIQYYFEEVYFYHPLAQDEFHPTRFLICLKAKSKIPKFKVPVNYLENLVEDPSFIIQRFVQCSNSIYLTERLENYQRIETVVTQSGETTEFHVAQPNMTNTGIPEKKEWLSDQFQNESHQDNIPYSVIRRSNHQLWIDTFLNGTIKFDDFISNNAVKCGFSEL